MRIIITENQLKTILLTETKTIVVPDNQLDRAKSLVDKLKGKGFTLSQSAAMVGNMWIESGFDPDSESSNGAIGLMQWLGNRKSALKKYAEHKGTDWTSENTQLNFIKVELKDGYELYVSRTMKPLKDADLDNEIDKGQLSLWENECEGLCGV